MDKMIFTALNALNVIRDTRVIQAQNLANQNTVGYRRDLGNEGNTYFLGDYETAKARAFQLEKGPSGFVSTPGQISTTGEPLDLAIADDGYFFVRNPSGELALTRRGDFRPNVAGQLETGSGELVLDANLAPIDLPPYRSIVVSEIGDINYEVVDGPPGVFEYLATVGTVVTGADVKLRKDIQGNIFNQDGDLPQPNQQARIVQGALEGSNVNAVDELIKSMEVQRQFEFGLRMVNTAKELDEGGARLLRMPE